MLKTSTTSLEGVLLIELEAFEDHRGYYVETYNYQLYHEAGVNVDFVQDDYSFSRGDVLRGIHGDGHTWKLVSCPFGQYFLAVVDCRQDKESFGRWESFVVSDRNRRQVLIPPGFGNGHLILSDHAMFQYKQSAYYEAHGQFSYRWDEPRFNIWWPIKTPILSRRDEAGAYI
ncbi:MAG: dTDP-4-dehydrorhamnose 3,5-epimerase family protein [Planctomycetes bacterium]|nr:dTDP-4-dehydrorhamnose 3,5-epimerase family protein [Planctomycetota bacterium]